MKLADRRLISISMLPLLAGAIFESRRISRKWTDVLTIILVSFGISFLTFLPGKKETHYNFEHHIEIWPYAFLGIFLLASIIFHGRKVILEITEGITLLQSIAVIYWVIDQGWAGVDNIWVKILMGIGLAFSLFALFHAFTYAALTPRHRLALSIWSSIIMMLFAIDHMVRVFGGDMDNGTNLGDELYMGLQYFLLGVSSIYMMQNVLMLIGFLPGRDTFFNRRYFQQIGELQDDHIGRYSERQVHVAHSLFCVIFSAGIFYLNYNRRLLPAHTIIWVVFTIFPMLLTLLNVLAPPRRGR